MWRSWMFWRLFGGLGGLAVVSLALLGMLVVSRVEDQWGDISGKSSGNDRFKKWPAGR
jgi:hypothetical protein